MKRLITAMLVSAVLSLSGCSKAPAPSAESNPAQSAAVAQAAAPRVEASTETTGATDAQATVVAAESAPAAVSEMDSEESVEPSPAIAQPLALRIAETKPEPASQFKEGVNYMRLVPAQPSSGPADEVEVTEAFWYGCPHCYALDPFLESWRKQGKPAYVNFVRIPAIWNERMRTHARIFYTAELLGKLDELHGEVFNEIHQRNDPLNTAESVEAFFTAHGVAKDAFEKAFSSFSVESNLKRALTLNERYRVDSVPTIIVNGKYVTDVGKAGGQKQLIALINELAAREHGT